MRIYVLVCTALHGVSSSQPKAKGASKKMRNIPKFRVVGFWPPIFLNFLVFLFFKENTQENLKHKINTLKIYLLGGGLACLSGTWEK